MILPIYVHFNGQTFSSVFEQLSFTSKFVWLKMQKSTFLEKMVLREVFIKLAFRWLQTGLSALKNTKQLKFCLWWIFYAFLKCCIFRDFFLNSPVFPGKIVKCILFYLNTVGQTQYNLISPFLAIIYFRLLYTSGFNVRV